VFFQYRHVQNLERRRLARSLDLIHCPFSRPSTSRIPMRFPFPPNLTYSQEISNFQRSSRNRFVAHLFSRRRCRSDPPASSPLIFLFPFFVPGRSAGFAGSDFSFLVGDPRLLTCVQLSRFLCPDSTKACRLSLFSRASLQARSLFFASSERIHDDK